MSEIPLRAELREHARAILTPAGAGSQPLGRIVLRNRIVQRALAADEFPDSTAYRALHELAELAIVDAEILSSLEHVDGE